MDWKNALEGAGGIHIFQPREPLQDAVDRMTRLVTQRSKDESINQEEALRRVIRERHIGRCTVVALLASMLVLCLVFAHAGQDGFSLVCALLFGVIWIVPQCVPLPDAATYDGTD